MCILLRYIYVFCNTFVRKAPKLPIEDVQYVVVLYSKEYTASFQLILSQHFVSYCIITLNGTWLKKVKN